MTHHKKAILIQYLGSNKNLTAGKMYTRDELAKAYNISKTTVCLRLSGKMVARDKDFEMTNTKKINGRRYFEKIATFIGHDSRFERGKSYTVNNIAEISNLDLATIKRRIVKRNSFCDDDLRPLKKCTAGPSQFDNYAESVSACWLKRKL
jgi:hypothetical protein